MKARVVRALRPLDAVSMGITGYRGTPDVNFVEGWLELKQLKHWPKNASTIVRVPIFEKQQRVWLARRRASGGRAFLLLQVGLDWLLFDGAVAAEHVGYDTKAKLVERALKHWPEGLDEEELCRSLQER